MVHQFGGRMQPRAEGPANVLAMGTAVPPFVHETSTYPDYYFGMTNSNHKTGLKDKFKRICDKMQITKRHMVVTKELVEEYPCLATYKADSLSDRHEIVMEWIPKLAREAAEAAIKDWGGSKSDITHIVMSTASVVNMPGVDLLVAKDLGLNTTKLRRVMMYYAGCYAGGSTLRTAKDLAENNKGARVLVICVDCTAALFRAPSEEYLDGLVGHGLFGDGAAAVVVGADPCPPFERPLYEIQWAGTAVVPHSLDAITDHPTEHGLYFHLSRHLPNIVSKNIGEALIPATEFVGVSNPNDMFWALHPGGVDILNKVQNEMNLTSDKLKASRQVLDNYGNLQGACVLFVLEQIRQNSIKAGARTTGEGKDLGLLIGIGPGLTVETLVLKSVPITAAFAPNKTIIHPS